MRRLDASLTNAIRVRSLLSRADLSEQAAAVVLELNETEMRAYCAGERPVPRVVILALERLADVREMAPRKR